MHPNAFIGAMDQPVDVALSTALGPAKLAWDRLLSRLEVELGAGVLEWKCHSPKWGWSLRVIRKKRTIVWLSPARDVFEVLFILGDRAMAAARQARLPQRIVRAIDTAPKYPEGTGVRLAVKSPRDVGGLMKLAAIKVAN